MAGPEDSEKTDPGITTHKGLDLGILNSLMSDPQITEIMINDTRNVIVEKDGKMMTAGFGIRDAKELQRLTRIFLSAGGTGNDEQPYADVMLPDGSRVNIVSPPITVTGPCITIRKFPTRRLGLEDLVANGMLDRKMAHFLKACVEGKINVLLSGGTDTGKTTFLTALLAFVPKSERVVTIEDTPEILLTHANSVAMQTKPQTPTSEPISARELVANAMRMRPDRVIVGECRKAEAFDMLQAMNTGHAGSMTTIHANSPRDALSRLETLCMLAGADLPLIAVRKQMASALDLIVQIKRFRDGKRRVTAVTEVIGMEGDTVTLGDVYTYVSDAAVFKATGFVPTLAAQLREQGIDIANDYFS